MGAQDYLVERTLVTENEPNQPMSRSCIVCTISWKRALVRERQQRKQSKGRRENEGFRFRGVGFIRTVISPLNKKLVTKSLGLSEALPIFVIAFLLIPPWVSRRCLNTAPIKGVRGEIASGSLVT